MKMRLIAAVAAAVLMAGPAFAASSSTTTSSTTSGAMTAPTSTMAPKTAKPKTASVRTTTRYYIAEAPNTTSCSVVSSRPDGKTMMMVGKYYYSTKAGATSAIKKMSGCK